MQCNVDTLYNNPHCIIIDFTKQICNPFLGHLWPATALQCRYCIERYMLIAVTEKWATSTWICLLSKQDISSTCSSAQYSISKLEIGHAKMRRSQVRPGFRDSSLWGEWTEIRSNSLCSPYAVCDSMHNKASESTDAALSLTNGSWRAAEGGPCKLSRASHSEFVRAACCFSLSAITRGCFIYLTKEQMLVCNALTEMSHSRASILWHGKQMSLNVLGWWCLDRKWNPSGVDCFDQRDLTALRICAGA